MSDDYEMTNERKIIANFKIEDPNYEGLELTLDW